MKKEVTAHTQENSASYATVQFGFWLYLMTDLVLFACLFATYAVLRGNTFDGPSGKDIFDANYVLFETLFLLVSSFTAGLALLSAYNKKTSLLVVSLCATFLLGATFLGMELTEFNKLVVAGFGWDYSAFLSSYFTLVGTHGLHIFVGLLWLVALITRVLTHEVSDSLTHKMLLWSMFWHFLDVVWICIFSVVYLMGLI
jgi:cytochrome o ubiquinol oxidase subunit 3